MSRKTLRPVQSLTVEGIEWITLAEFARRLKVSEGVRQWAADHCPILGRRLPTRVFRVERAAGRGYVKLQDVRFVEARYVEEILAKAKAQRCERIERAGEWWLSRAEAARIAAVSESSILRWRREPCPHLGRRIRTRTHAVPHFPRQGKRATLYYNETDCRAIAAALAEIDADLLPVADSAKLLGYAVHTVKRLATQKTPIPALDNRPLRSECRYVRNRRGHGKRTLCAERCDIEALRSTPHRAVEDRIEWNGETWLRLDAAAGQCGVKLSTIRNWYRGNCPQLGRPLRIHRVRQPPRGGRIGDRPIVRGAVASGRTGAMPQIYVALADVEAVVKVVEATEKPKWPVEDRIEWNGEKWLSDKAAADYSGASRWSIRRWFDAKCPQLGRPLRIHRVDELRRPGMGRGRLPRTFVALADLDAIAAAIAAKPGAAAGNREASPAAELIGNEQPAPPTANGADRAAAAAPKGKAGRPARRREEAEFANAQRSFGSTWKEIAARWNAEHPDDPRNAEEIRTSCQNLRRSGKACIPV